MEILAYLSIDPRFHPKFSLLAARTEFRVVTIYSTIYSFNKSIEFLFCLLDLHNICRTPRYSSIERASMTPLLATLC